jgi:hypothetical protein
VENRADQLRTLPLWKRARTGGHLVEHGAGGVDVAARVSGKRPQLFGRHVRNSSGNRTRLDGDAERDIVGHFGVHESGQAKIKNLQPAVGSNDQISRFEIAVYHALRVRGYQAIGKLNAEAQNISFGQRPFGESCRQRTSLNQLHHQEVQTVLCAEFMDRLDVRMIQLGQRQSFLAELFSRSFIPKSAGREDFHGYIAVELFITGAIDFAHAAGADLRNDATVPEGLANHGSVRALGGDVRLHLNSSLLHEPPRFESLW